MKTCILVGYGPGLGAALARAFGREGFALALLARSPATLASGERELAGRGVRAKGFVADAADEHALQHALRHAEQELGPAGVLIHNAYASHAGPPSHIHREALLGDFRVNVAGALTAAQHVLPGMRARGKGTLLFTGGGLALHPTAPLASLSLGKAALRSLALSLEDELAPDGIHAATVTIRGAIKPGTAFDPDLVASAFLELHLQPAGAWLAERVIG